MSNSQYDIAQICTNGHVINPVSLSIPEGNTNFCQTCGAPTITQCPNCNEGIRGYYRVSKEEPSLYQYRRPAFCHHCGKPYPWTEAKLKAAQDLADEVDNLNAGERNLLKKSLDDIVRDTPQTPVAATRFKRIVAKVGKVAADGFRDILVDIISEAAKKVIWP